MANWTKKSKGWSTIWTHPKLVRAIVDTNGYGINSRISYNGLIFETVKAAKRHAESEIVEDINEQR